MLLIFPKNKKKMGKKKFNPRTFFDITIGGEFHGRIVFELFADVVPRTAESKPFFYFVFE